MHNCPLSETASSLEVQALGPQLLSRESNSRGGLLGSDSLHPEREHIHSSSAPGRRDATDRYADLPDEVEFIVVEEL